MELFSGTDLLSLLWEDPLTALAGSVVLFGILFLCATIIEEITIRLFGIWGGRILFALGILGFVTTFVCLFIFEDALYEPTGVALFVGSLSVSGAMWFTGWMVKNRILHPELFRDD